ncbi:MAG: TetR family transcriptional regulator C-terminal domain-containing protein [Pseudooceanicola sp.]|nr:TetR family transcriptional regulator C-terminal domain-containing protein [Pseudooceanicola sp.]
MPIAPTEPPRQRKERKQNADKRRRQVLDATYRSIVTNGLQRTTLATVAEEAGLSQGVAVFYFKSKNGLLSEALRDLYITYETHWQDAIDAAGTDAAARLMALVRADFDPKICNASILSVWFAFWGEQKFTPQYGAITSEYDDNRLRAIRDICAHLLPADPDRAHDIADWVDTLTDGYWQNLHLFPTVYTNAGAERSTLRALRALLPEFADRLNPD